MNDKKKVPRISRVSERKSDINRHFSFNSRRSENIRLLYLWLESGPESDGRLLLPSVYPGRCPLTISSKPRRRRGRNFRLAIIDPKPIRQGVCLALDACARQLALGRSFASIVSLRSRIRSGCLFSLSEIFTTHRPITASMNVDVPFTEISGYKKIFTYCYLYI